LLPLKPGTWNKIVIAARQPQPASARASTSDTRAITLRRASGTDIVSMSWAADVSGESVPLVANPYRQTKQGVGVEVNRGGQSFAATFVRVLPLEVGK
jgi:hypothetical protein